MAASRSARNPRAAHLFTDAGAKRRSEPQLPQLVQLRGGATIGLAAVVAGAVAACGFAPLGLWPLTLAGLVVLQRLVAHAPTRRSAAWRGWLWGVGHFTLGNHWIAHAFVFQDAMPAWLGFIAVVALALYLGCFTALAAVGAWGPRAAPLRYALGWGAAWIVTEWLRGTVFTGFAWNPIGIVWIDAPAARSATLVGTYGLSGLTALLAGLLPAALHAVRVRRADEGLVIAALALAIAVPVAPLLLAPDPAVRPAMPRALVVQPGVGQSAGDDPAFVERRFDRLVALTGPGGASARLVLWPEAAVPALLEDQPWARQSLAQLLGPRDLLLAGGDALVRDAGGRVVGARNAVFALAPDATLVGRYDKAHLVPYGEYLPMRPLLSAIGLSRVVPGELDFVAGPGPRTLDLPAGPVGLQVCYEIVFSGEVVDRAHRPLFVFNPSNDAWFGAWGPPQQWAQARLRALEEGLPVVRSTPTGVTGVIDADGRSVAVLPRGGAGVLALRLPSPHPPTPFARVGNFAPALLALLLALGAVARVRPRV